MESYENFNANEYDNSDEPIEEVSLKSNLNEIFHDEEFGTHFRVFVIIIGSLFALDILTGGGFWFQFIAISWGIGVSCHFWDTYLEYYYKNSKKRDLYMHGAVTGTLVIFFFLMDLFTSWRLNWWLYPSIPLIGAWLIHRATVFNPNTSQSGNINIETTQTNTAKNPHNDRSEQSSKRYCANCGGKLEHGFKFCKYCGKEIRDEL